MLVFASVLADISAGRRWEKHRAEKPAAFSGTGGFSSFVC